MKTSRTAKNRRTRSRRCRRRSCRHFAEFREPDHLVKRHRSRQPSGSGVVHVEVVAAGRRGRCVGLVVLGVIIVIITKNGRITIDTEKGTTTITAIGRRRQWWLVRQCAASRKFTGGQATCAARHSCLGHRDGRGPRRVRGAHLRSLGEAPRVRRAATPKGDRPADTAAGTCAVRPQPLPLITNSIGMKLALIPAGEFMMGSPDDDKDAPANEKPQHRVRITSPFYLGVYEVTQAQYEAVMGNNPSSFSSTGAGETLCRGRSTGQHPVECVSWLDAVRFCNALSGKEGLSSLLQRRTRRRWRFRTGRHRLSAAHGGGMGIRLPGGNNNEVLLR